MSHQAKAIKLSFLVHSALICIAVLLSRYAAPEECPLVIDFSIETTGLTIEKAAKSAGSTSGAARQKITPDAPPSVGPATVRPEKISPNKPDDAYRKTARQKKSLSPQRQADNAKKTAKEKPKEQGKSIPVAEEQKSGPTDSTSMAADAEKTSSDAHPVASAAGETASCKQSGAVADQNHATGGGESARNYLQYNFAYIRNLIMRNLSFPAAARKLGWTGKISVAFIIREDGSVEDINIVSGSGHEVLDINVISAIRRTAPFPEPPVKARFILPIVYSLK
ncbi:MAG: energy transducer TonB [Proteobacteria bacterium]|nr:energy transducer TonB [Pseudomonadota bacterium]MBU4295963.1 energy transducer TonB [Pseudomonadota bacterium]MCG2746173.1 energy transducer TonB [Desulfobulbaceae bacterium]